MRFFKTWTFVFDHFCQRRAPMQMSKHCSSASQTSLTTSLLLFWVEIWRKAIESLCQCFETLWRLPWECQQWQHIEILALRNVSVLLGQCFLIKSTKRESRLKVKGLFDIILNWFYKDFSLIKLYKFGKGLGPDKKVKIFKYRYTYSNILLRWKSLIFQLIVRDILNK